MDHRFSRGRRAATALTLTLICALAAALGARAADAEAVASLRLYTIDCGQIEVSDMSDFSDTGEYDGQSATLASPCFLVRHPKGTLLWDLGLGDRKDGVTDGPFHLVVRKSLSSQLAQIGLKPGDVGMLAFSHLHWDHTGNANAFPQATWLIPKAEFEWATSLPTPGGVDLDSISAYRAAKVVTFEGDRDVFGDGSVRILRANGHTPGHSVLMLKLKNSGTVVLSGDLYHAMRSRRERLIPAFNVSRADTLASIERIERIVQASRARFVIQHAREAVDALPKFPAYLD
jgi:glyoxylase-like metal-dependent hydrolase (beta-lactamase superfamily II)